MALALLLVTSAVLSPWILRNRLVFGRWIATTTHGGYTLLLGNNPHFYRHLRSDAWGQIWTLPSDDYVMRQCREAQPDVAARLALLAPTEREIAEDALAYACACRHIADDPGAFVLACAYRAGQFITPLPHATFAPESLVRCVLRYAIGLWYLMLYASLLASVMRRGRDLVRPEWLPLAVLVLGLAAAHLTYWSNLHARPHHAGALRAGPRRLVASRARFIKLESIWKKSEIIACGTRARRQPRPKQMP